jgi:hypothetical protein
MTDAVQRIGRFNYNLLWSELFRIDLHNQQYGPSTENYYMRMGVDPVPKMLWSPNFLDYQMLDKLQKTSSFMFVTVNVQKMFHTEFVCP